MLNRFPTNTKPHENITIDYYISSLLTCIMQLVKRTAKGTLTENYEEDIAIEMDLRTIGAIVDEE